MLSALESAILDDLKRRLSRRFGPRVVRVVLFGSRARGEGHEESDLDVLVVVRDLRRDERRAVVDEAYDLELAYGVAVAPLVRDEAARLGAALSAEIDRDGIAL